MEITEIRVFAKEGQDKKLKGYATVTLDDAFVVRNIKVIQGSGGLFVAMPSRKMKYPCSSCSAKNEVGSNFCNQCGKKLHVHFEEQHDDSSDAKNDHRDIAHPINQEFREYLQTRILQAFEKAVTDVTTPEN